MSRLKEFLWKVAAGVLTIGMGCLPGALHAQGSQTAQPAEPDNRSVAKPEAQLPVAPVSAEEPSFSSSAMTASMASSADAKTGGELALNTTPTFHFADAMQYGGRRRYGKPRYRGNNTNPDGSNKWAFVVGGGMTLPTNTTDKYNTVSYSVKVGAGRNFNKMFGLLAEYNYDRFGLTGTNLTNQENLYNSLGYVDNNNSPVSFAGLDGNAHTWSLTLNPIIHLYDTDSLGFYVVGGGGFYRKLTNFTLPVTGFNCDPYYGCYYYGASQTIDHYSNNAGGVNGGIGFTYKLSKFANEKLFAEARYTWIANSQSQNSVNGLYPQNNLRTIYVPVTFGLRW